MSSDMERRTGGNNLGIHGDAQDAEELAGRGLNLVRDAFTTLDEAYRTVKRIREENNAHGSKEGKA